MWKTFFSLPKDKRKRFIINWGLARTLKNLLEKYEIFIQTLFHEYHYNLESLYPRFKKMKLKYIENIYNASEKEIISYFNILFVNCIEQDRKEILLLDHLAQFVLVAEKQNFSPNSYEILWRDYCLYRHANSFNYTVRIKEKRRAKTKIVLKKDQLAKRSLKEVKQFILISEQQMHDIIEKIINNYSESWNFDDIDDDLTRNLEDIEIPETLEDNLNRFYPSLNNAQDVYIINKYLKVALINNSSIIFVNDLPFMHCNYLLVNIPKENIEDYDDIQSIDDLADSLNNVLERHSYLIPPETEFWGHCSNLQAWYEHGYDSCLLHSNLSFPLLKKLYETGDHQATRVFKDEIFKRFEQGNLTVQISLLEGKYLNYLSAEERQLLLQNIDYEKIMKRDNYLVIVLLVKLSFIGDLTSKEILKQQIASVNTYSFFFALRRKFFSILDIEEIRNLINSLKDILRLESEFCFRAIAPFIIRLKN